MENQDGRLEVLSEAECMSLLASNNIGRIGFTDRALPSIALVNYVLHDGTIVFRSLGGSKLAAALRHDVVAFEVDSIDPTTGSGWSVVVVGEARPVINRAEADLLALLPLNTWVAEPRPEAIVRIELTVVSGRRINPRHQAPQPVSSQDHLATDDDHR